MALPTFLRPPVRLSLADRRVLTLMVVAGIAAGYAGSLLTHTFPFARKSMELTEGQMSWVVAATRTASLLALAFSTIGDRRGRRLPFLVAFSLLPIANLATALLPGVPSFVAFQSMARVGAVATSALAIVILAEELNPRLRGYGLGIFTLSGAMGGGLSLLILPIADVSDGAWRVLFGLSGVMLLGVPLLRVFLRESRAFVPVPRRPPLGAVFRRGHARYLLPLAGMAFFISLFSAPAIKFAMERLIDDLGWGTDQARLLLIVFSGFGTMGVLVGGRVSDLVGRRPTEILALLVGLVGGVAFYVFDSGWILGPAMFLSAFGASAVSPALSAHRAELFPTGLRATAIAWINNAAILGGIVAFVVGGLVIDSIGLSTTMVLLSVGVIVAAFLVLPLPETRGRDLVTRRPAPSAASATTTPAPPPAPRSSS